MAFDPKTLQLGDILITVADNFVSHCGIVAGNVSSGTNVMNRVERPGLIYHATTGGIKTDDPGQWAATRGKTGVFRLKGLRFITIGKSSAEAVIAAAAVSLSKRCSYSKSRAFVLSWSGTSEYGSSAKGRLHKYMARLGAGGNAFITTVYCSEFVVLSFQLAAKGDENASFFIDLDGKHTLPKDLRNWLLARTKVGGKWQFLGEFG